MAADVVRLDMEVSIRPSSVAGVARAPGSKSYSHRAILAAGYADGGRVNDPLVSADTRATMRVVDQFGGDVEVTDQGLKVTGFGGRPNVPSDVIDCANSGTTMRLVTATAGLADGITVLTGDRSLRSRPHGPLLDALNQLGARAESSRGNGQAPLVIRGPIDGGSVSIPGDVSSQFITALLMAGAITAEGIDIELETALKSAPYVDITREVLDAFGIKTEADPDGFHVPGGQAYEPEDGEYSVPGDFSSLSYLLAAGAVAGDGPLRLRRAFPSAQGDTAIVDILAAMEAELSWDRDDGVITVWESDLAGTTVDVGDTPDLLPTIAVLGAVADGETRITNAEHVRYKETDRVAAMAEALTRMGAEVEEFEDELVIHGGDSTLAGAVLDGRGDHRIVMALAVAALSAEGETTIRGAEHVDVSFPGFFDVLYDLGVDLSRN